jgi:hypothetical protein
MFYYSKESISDRQAQELLPRRRDRSRYRYDVNQAQEFLHPVRRLGDVRDKLANLGRRAPYGSYHCGNALSFSSEQETSCHFAPRASLQHTASLRLVAPIQA